MPAMETQTAATRTFVAYKHAEDGLWADSPQLPGWTAIAEDETELFRLVAESPSVHLGWRPGSYNTVLMDGFGATAHTFTPQCAGHHPMTDPCPEA